MSSLPSVTTSTETKPAVHPPRRIHSVEKKRRIVEETFQPHASVARVVQAHGVNANQVFYWRKQYQQGLLGPTQPKAALLPVQIADLVLPEPMSTAAEKNEALISVPPRAETKPTGTIHLELAKAKLYIQGVADPVTLRTLLDCLLG
jgi:transposase